MPFFFKVFDSKMASREKLFKAAVDFANKIGRERLINITHSEDHDNIVIAIWYWSDQEEKDEKQVKKPGDFKAPSTARPGAPALEPSSSSRILEQSSTVRAPDSTAPVRPPAPPVLPALPTPVQEIILPVPPPPPQAPPEKSVEDSW